MTTYCSLDELKAYLGTRLDTDDTEIQARITEASAAIDVYCQRVFVGAAATRAYDAVQAVDGRTLLLDEDLLSVTTITNGDGTALDSGDYVLLPANVTPKYAVRLKASSGVSWTYTTDPEDAISVNGTWGYANTQPDTVRHACIRLAAWYYRQKDAPFETTGMPDLGLVTVPASIPADVTALLDPYVRHRIGSV